MKVKDLIEELKELPPDLPVYYMYWDNDDKLAQVEVEGATVVTTDIEFWAQENGRWVAKKETRQVITL